MSAGTPPPTQLGMNGMMTAFMTQAVVSTGQLPSIQQMLQHMIGEPVQDSVVVTAPQPGTADSAGTTWTPGDHYGPLVIPWQQPSPLEPSSPHIHPMIPSPIVDDDILIRLGEQQRQAQAEALRRQCRALLRPLAAPLYDSAPVGVRSIEEMEFFGTGVGDFDPVDGKQKTPWLTNVGPGGRLVAPDEFSMLGLSFAMVGFDKWTVHEFRSEGLVNFALNDKTIFEIPMLRVPIQDTNPASEEMIKAIPQHGEVSEADDVLLAAQTGKALEEIRESRVTPVEYYADEVEKYCERNRNKPNFYQFTLGKQALRITPTDSFRVRIRFPRQYNFGAEGGRVVAFLEGTLWRIP